MNTLINFLEFVSFLIPVVLAVLSWSQLKKHIKVNHPKEYKTNYFEPEGYIVSTITPNLFLISSDAKDLARVDKQFKKLRRTYGISILLVFIWIIFLL